MSGGVDSSVAAALLKERGYGVVGITMKIWDGEETSDSDKPSNSCYGPGELQNINDAKKAADRIGVPLVVLDLRKEYKSIVLDYVSNEYLSGRTPNPCVLCNKLLKLDILPNKAREAGLTFNYVATGHYVRKKYARNKKRYLLLKAKDKEKDQTYFLYLLSQDQIEECLFPLGDFTKKEIREVARDMDLPVKGKEESQDFFSGGVSSLFGGNERPGKIMDKKGEILGEHRGIQYYTIGQRRGLGIAKGVPLYVIEIDRKTNSIIVGEKKDLFKKELLAGKLNWISIGGLNAPIEVRAKIRYRHKAAKAVVSPYSDDTVLVEFGKPQSAVTPGQAVVFYQDDVVVGGGTIKKERRER